MQKYTNEYAYKAALDYFGGDDLAARVWVNKYALRDSDGVLYEKSPDEMHWRLAKELARIESKYPNPMSVDDIYKLLKEFKYVVPQGSPMAGIGNNLQTISLSNCFVIGNHQNSDSYGGIMRADEELVQLMKRRGGVGHDLSHIRPRGTSVKNSAITSTGVVPFMERYSNSTREVSQEGRRGALMLSLSINHPDAQEFMDAKLDSGKVTGANVSLRIDDAFMEAVVANTTYVQKYPTYSTDPKVTKCVNARDFWKKIVHNAWKSAEPGLLFWDTITRESIPDCYADLGYKTVSTNPCFPASEFLLTDTGYNRFGDLFEQGGANKVVCDNRVMYEDDGGEENPENWKIDNTLTGTTIRQASHVFLTQDMSDIIEITTAKGFRLRCTPDHHIATHVGMVEAKDLTPDHKILISVPEPSGSIIGKVPTTTLEKIALLIGLITGDGTFDKNKNRVHLDFWGDNRWAMRDLVCGMIDTLHSEFGAFYNNKNRAYSKYYITDIPQSNKLRISSAWLSHLLNIYGFNRALRHDVPNFIMSLSSTNVGKYYLAGLFYCDGSVQGNKVSGYSIRLSQSHLGLVRKVQMILHSNGMIFGIYHRRGGGMSLLPNGKGNKSLYKTKDQYELISLAGSFTTYRDTIGFMGRVGKEDKMHVVHNFRSKGAFYDTVSGAASLPAEPVYCIQEPVSRSIVVNGISARRCGEIPLCPYDSCRLLAINLFSYVVNPFTKDAYFDFELFKKHVGYAQRIMDDIIDLELEKIDAILVKINSDPEPDYIKNVEIGVWKEIRKKAELGRRTGLGITAEGDMLAALGIRYGSEEGNAFAVSVHKALALSAYRSSVEMAKERGAFAIYDASREAGNPFVQRIKEADPTLYNDMREYGRRNIALLTIAPTGSTSILTQTTSGIEPVFMPVYKRRRKVNPNDKGVRVDFIDEVGDSWEEYIVFHPRFKQWMEVNGYDTDKIYTDTEIDELIEQSPYYKATSNDVDWLAKVEMQGAIQKWVDHSISVTINVPSDVSEELVSDLYLRGWEVGCKGITVYRDGSRSGVLISAKDSKPDVKKRPKELPADILRFNNNKDKWIAFVGLKDGVPYEIFTGIDSDSGINIPRSITGGSIVKTKVDGVSSYDFRYRDSSGKDVIVSGLSNKFNPVFWNYAKLISGVLRHGMPIDRVVMLVNSLQLDDDSINTWKAGVSRALKIYIPNGTEAKGKCGECGSESVMYQEGCLSCKNCGSSKCG